MQRLIRPSDIPETLWRSEHQQILLAPGAIDAWTHLLRDAGLMERALQSSPEGFVGGITKEETDNHLAWRFSGSCARVQLGFLDPKNELSGICDAFARVFSGGKVLLADLPCGSGAAALTILATIAELRRTGRVPREPLSIKVVGGEVSPFALENAQNAIESIKESLAEQAITVSTDFISWDVFNNFSTADLTNRLTLLGHDCSARLIVVANCSGFLQKAGKWDAAMPQFESLFVHGRANESYVIWIEPNTNSVLGSGGFFGRVIKWYRGLFSKRATPEQQASLHVDNIGRTSADVQHPLRDEHRFHVTLAIQRFDLPITGTKT